MTHNFVVGTWRKKKQTAADHAKFLMNSTNAQRSFIHEVTSQMLGHAPSALWGHPVPDELMPHADDNTLAYVRHASKHSAHEFGRLISEHKRASGWASALGEVIGDAAKTAGRYAKTAATFAIKHGDEIKQGVGILKGLVQTGTTIAQLAGGMSKDRKSTLDQIANAIDAHAQSDVYKSKKPAKKGGGLIRV